MHLPTSSDASISQEPEHPATHEEILTFARLELQRFHEEHHGQPTTQDVPESAKFKCTVAMGHMNITSLPSELIDIIKDHVDKVAFNQNKLSSLSGIGPRMSECTHLKYLVLRGNLIKEFPLQLLDVSSLELLDLRGNKIESLPEDLNRLSNLRSLSVRQNKITKLPVCIGQMATLLRLETRRNPITFPPKEEWEEADSDNEDRGNTGLKTQNETKKIKAFMLDYSNRKRVQAETQVEMSEGNVETPRPTRRKASGRFPIVPSVSSTSLNSEPPPKSPSLPKAPPIPTMTRSKTFAETQTTSSRPQLAPLNINNERYRSNSESHMSNNTRMKRMGMIEKKPPESARLEPKKSNRLSHLRGLSHGSALLNGGTSSNVTDSSNPSSPTETPKLPFVQRLSSLPEGKRKSRLPDPFIDFARGVSFSLHQVYQPLKRLMLAASDGSSKQTNFQRAIFSAGSNLEELDRQLSLLEREDDEDAEDDGRKRSTLAAQNSCDACLSVFRQLAATFRKNLRLFVSRSSPQHVRSLMHLLYASLIELRIACSRSGIELTTVPRSQQQKETGRNANGSPDSRRPVTSVRVRDTSTIQIPSRSTSRQGYYASTFNNTSRTTSTTSLNPSLPLDSYSSFSSSVAETPRNIARPPWESDVDGQFEDILWKLNGACNYILEALPRFSTMLSIAFRSRSYDSDPRIYDIAASESRALHAHAESLVKYVSKLQARDDASTYEPEFWRLCTAFTRAHLIFMYRIKDMVGKTLIAHEVVSLLRPVAHAVKEASISIKQSPWSPLCDLSGGSAKTIPPTPVYSSSDPTRGMHKPSVSQTGSSEIPRSAVPAPALQQPTLPTLKTSNLPTGTPEALSAVSSHSHGTSGTGNLGSVTSGLTSGYVTPLPATPLSAALGPAAGATMPVGLGSSVTTPATATKSYFEGVGPLPVNGTINQSISHAQAVARSRSVSQRR